MNRRRRTGRQDGTSSAISPSHCCGPSSLLYLAISAGAIVMIVPLVYMVSTSFMPHAYVLKSPPEFIPSHPTFANYISAWQANNFGEAFLNSIIVAGCATVLNLLLASSL